MKWTPGSKLKKCFSSLFFAILKTTLRPSTHPLVLILHYSMLFLHTNAKVKLFHPFFYNFIIRFLHYVMFTFAFYFDILTDFNSLANFLSLRNFFKVGTPVGFILSIFVSCYTFFHI